MVARYCPIGVAYPCCVSSSISMSLTSKIFFIDSPSTNHKTMILVGTFQEYKVCKIFLSSSYRIWRSMSGLTCRSRPRICIIVEVFSKLLIFITSGQILGEHIQCPLKGDPLQTHMVPYLNIHSFWRLIAGISVYGNVHIMSLCSAITQVSILWSNGGYNDNTSTTHLTDRQWM